MPDRPQIIWRMRVAFWIHKTTNTQSIYVIIIAFPLQRCLHERVSISRYTYVRTDRRTDRHTERQTDRQPDRQTVLFRITKTNSSPPQAFTSAKFSSAFYHLPKRLFRLADAVA